MTRHLSFFIFPLHSAKTLGIAAGGILLGLFLYCQPFSSAQEKAPSALPAAPPPIQADPPERKVPPALPAPRRDPFYSVLQKNLSPAPTVSEKSAVTAYGNASARPQEPVRLLGIFTAGGTRRALLRTSKGTHLYQEGDPLEGVGQITAIKAREITCGEKRISLGGRRQ
jgi:hypothetical protein